MDITKQEKYAKDSRTPCKYGADCYQKNPFHTSKYKHPPKKQPKEETDIEQSAKRLKLDKVEESFNNSEKPKKDVIPTGSFDNDEKTNSVQEINHIISDDKEKIQIDVPGDIDEKEFIKSNFLVEMPPDFYSFWDFCKTLNSSNPLMALDTVGLVLVGPFEVLAGKFKDTPRKTIEEYALHWRYYYDPPEFQTVIKRNDNSGYHLGYFRDSPDELPKFLAYNFAKSDGKFTIVGKNLFAAVNSFLNFLKKNGNPFMKTSITRYGDLIRTEAHRLKYNLSDTLQKHSPRNLQMITRTFNTLGIVVPYNKKTQVGYRPLTISNKELQTLLSKLENASGDERDKLMIQFQEVLTNTNIAIDECDFGTGLELGLNILYSGVESLNSVAARLLATCYKLLNRDAFAVIIESHMKKREKGFNLSILQ